MADGWGDTNANSDFAGGAAGFADIGGDDAQPEQIQEKKINKKKLKELEPSGKKLQVFKRDSKTRALVTCNEVKDVPADVAAICSDMIYAKLQKDKNYYHIVKGDEIDGYKFVFDWIKQCAAQQDVVNIDDVSMLITEDNNYKLLILVLKAANKLEIPDASFGKFIFKKCKDLARDHLVDLDLVRVAYDPLDPEEIGEAAQNGLRELFVKSIFDHWYNYKLETEEYADYMCTLYDKRQGFPELDQDLVNAVKDKDEFLKGARERRAAKKAEEDAAMAGGDADGFGGGETSGGWDGQTSGDGGAGGGGAGGGDWENNAFATEEPASNWAGKTVDEAGDGGIMTEESTNNWADEVNSNAFEAAPPVAPVMAW